MHFTFSHVSNGFEAAVRVIWKAARKFGDEIVKDNEGIETAELGGGDNEPAFVSIVFGCEDFLNGF